MLPLGIEGRAALPNDGRLCGIWTGGRMLPPDGRLICGAGRAIPPPPMGCAPPPPTRPIDGLAPPPPPPPRPRPWASRSSGVATNKPNARAMLLQANPNHFMKCHSSVFSVRVEVSRWKSSDRSIASRCRSWRLLGDNVLKIRFHHVSHHPV
jgi:hypothetical protein